MTDFVCTDGPPAISQAKRTYQGELTDVNALISRNDFIRQIPQIQEYIIKVFYMVVTGYVKIPSSGKYTFTLSANHGSRLYFIDYDNNGNEIEIISYWGNNACKSNNPEIRNIVDLDEKVYGFRLEVYGNSVKGFSFEYRYENREINDVLEKPHYKIPFQSNTKEFNLLRSIQLPHSHFIFSYNSYNKLPFHFIEGYSTNCYILPNNNNNNVLPNNLIVTNSTIEGTPIEEITEEKIYSLQCESEYSKTNSYLLNIRVLNNYRNGSVVKYMKIINFDSSCTTPYIYNENNNNNNIIVLMKRIETPIGTDPYTDLTIDNNNNPNEVRKGLSSDFISDFAVNYDGYLYLETSGIYGFKLNSTGGSWLYIDDELIVDNSGYYNHHNCKTNIHFKYYKSGYYNMKLVYVKSVGPYVLKFELKLPNNNLFIDAQNYMYFVAPSTLFYHSPMIMTVHKGVPLENTKVFIVGELNRNKVPKSYKLGGSNTVLPKGLLLDNETGRIYGNASETTSQPMDIDIVGIYDDNTEYTFKVKISITEFNFPSLDDDVIFSNNNKINVTANKENENVLESDEIVLKYGYYVNIRFDFSYAMKYSIIEENKIVVDGLIFNPFNHTIEGYPRCINDKCRLHDKGTIGINITNSIGFKILEINYRIESGLYLLNGNNEKCNISNNENLHMFIVNGTYNTYDMIYISLIDIENNNKIILDHISYNTFQNPSILSYCLEGKKYMFVMEDNLLSTNQITYSVYVNGYLIDSWSHFGTRLTYSYEIDTNLTEPFVIYNNNNNLLVIDIPSIINIKPIAQYGYIKEMYITPYTIPYDLNFNFKNGVITGTAFTTFEKMEYDVVARNSIGENKFKIILTSNNVGICNETHQNTIIINLKTDGNYYRNMYVNLFNLNDENNNVKEFNYLKEGSKLNGNYYYQDKYCIKEDKYKLILKDISNLNGWGDSYVEIIFNNINMGRWSLNERESEIDKEIEFNFGSILTNETIWEYYLPKDSKPQEYIWHNMTNLNQSYIHSVYNDSENWNNVTLPYTEEEIKNFFQRTLLLFRTNLPYIPSTNVTFPSFYLYIEYRCNLIVYINGVKLNEDIVSSDERDSGRLITRYILPSEILNRYPPVLGIEISNGHNSVIQIADLKVRMYELNSDSECFSLNHESGRIIDSSYYKYRNNNNDLNYIDGNVENVFDNNINTQWIDVYDNDGEYKSESFVKYNFGLRNYYFINNISYRINSEYDKLYPNEKPVHIILSSKSNAYSPSSNSNNNENNYNILSDDNDIEYHPINRNILQASNTAFSQNILENIGNEIIINITEIKVQNQNNLKMSISDINYGVCHRYFCSELYIYNYTLPVTQSGDYVVVPICPFSDIKGYNRTYYCSKGRNPTWSEVDNTCPTKPYLIKQYHEKLNYIAGNRYNDKLFELSGYKMKIRVEPPLPYALQISNDSNLIGWIFGQVYDPSEEKEYTFTVWNDYGETPIKLKIEVEEPNEPKFVNVTNTPLIFYAGTLYKNERIFNCIGKNLHFSISPDLPFNLMMDSKTGLVSGIPEIANENDENVNKQYTILAKNNFGEATQQVTIIIKEPDYLTLRKMADNFTYNSGFTYTNLELVRATGKNKKITIKPNLPHNLAINEENGLINGVVDVEEEDWINYTITSDNKVNTTSVNIIMRVVLLPYPVIQFIYDEYTFYMGELYSDLSLFIVKGRNMEYFVTPSLPDGLTLNRYTGKINGRLIKYPNIREREYTFTFDNRKNNEENGGDVRYGKIKLIFVYRDYPVVVSYEQNVSFIHGELLINRKIFTVVGEGLLYTVKPELPPLLKLSSNTGSISGLCKDKTPKNLYDFEISMNEKSVHLNISIEIINQYCKRDGEWEETEANTENEKSCGTNKVGLKYRKCKINSNNEAYWEKEFNNCNYPSELILSVTLCTITVFLVLMVIIIYVLIKKRRKYENEIREKDNRVV